MATEFDFRCSSEGLWRIYAPNGAYIGALVGVSNAETNYLLREIVEAFNQHEVETLKEQLEEAEDNAILFDYQRDEARKEADEIEAKRIALENELANATEKIAELEERLSVKGAMRH